MAVNNTLAPHFVVSTLRRHGFDCYSTTGTSKVPSKVYGIMPYTDRQGQLQFEHVEVECSVEGVRTFLGY